MPRSASTSNQRKEIYMDAYKLIASKKQCSIYWAIEIAGQNDKNEDGTEYCREFLEWKLFVHPKFMSNEQDDPVYGNPYAHTYVDGNVNFRLTLLAFCMAMCD